MAPRFENSDLTAQLLKSIIDIIGRRSSEGYAVVVVNNIIKKLTERYDFLRHIKIESSQYSESTDLITVGSVIDAISLNELRDALQELIIEIAKSIGEAAGYFFIKELKEYMGTDYELAFQNMGIDLGFMQFKQVVDKKQEEPSTKKTDTAAVIKHIMHALFDILDEETTLDFALSTMTNCIKKLTSEYDFLKYITLHDIRYIQGDETISVNQDINTIEPPKIGAAIEKLMIAINKSLEEKDIYSFIEKFKKHLNADDLSSIKKMGVNLKALQIDHELVFKHVIKALIDVVSRASTQSYAIFVIDAVLKKVDTKYDFLKYVKIDSTRYSEGIDAISIMTNIDSVNPIDAGRAIQKIIEEIVKTIGKEVGQHFIEEFKNSLEKSYLLRMEEMGVNLHMIQLRQDLTSMI